jgi:branched-chain amino acid transport system permease protein
VGVTIEGKTAHSSRARGSERFKSVAINVGPFALFLVAYALMPRFAEDRQLTMLIYIGINVLLALGLNLLMGYAGQVSLGHAAFFGMGAYASAILTLRPIPGEVIPGFSVAVGAMMGTATLASLTRATGWKLAAGAAALLVLSWAALLVHAGGYPSVIVFAVGMGALGLLLRLDWRKTAVSGVAGALLWQMSGSFLEDTLARGGTSPWTGMAVGMFFTCLIAYLIGGQVLRLKGHYLAMATLGFGIIVEIVFRQWTAVTGGSSDGIFGIPTIQVIDSLPRIGRRMAEAAAGGQVDMRQQYFYLVWGFVFLALLLANNIVRSRVGRAFRAVHGSELAAESLGVDTERYKVQVFVFSAALASIAGSLHAHNAGIGYINPSEFSFMASVQLLVMVVIGGLASVWGSLFGAGAIQLLKVWMLNLEKSDHHLFGLALKGLDPIVFGGVLIAVMILVPQGLVRGGTDALSTAWRTVTGDRRRKTE